MLGCCLKKSHSHCSNNPCITMGFIFSLENHNHKKLPWNRMGQLVHYAQVIKPTRQVVYLFGCWRSPGPAIVPVCSALNALVWSVTASLPLECPSWFTPSASGKRKTLHPLGQRSGEHAGHPHTKHQGQSQSILAMASYHQWNCLPLNTPSKAVDPSMLVDMIRS